MKTTLIISTYNRPEALSVCLDSVRFQTVMPDEVIVGDDGSTSETKDLIESFKRFSGASYTFMARRQRFSLGYDAQQVCCGSNRRLYH